MIRECIEHNGFAVTWQALSNASPCPCCKEQSEKESELEEAREEIKEYLEDLKKDEI